MSDERRALEYQPALDGVRALAVTLVIVFHLGLTWMPGGYLGVSVFFTLSGFLITSLLLGEAATASRVSFRRFYARRARRLLPASLLVLLAVVVARWLGEFDLVPGLRADLLGALFQVFNWVQLAGSSSYTALFGQSPLFTSPLEHYWSLAIEEQFYLLWPVSFVALWRWRARRGRTVLGPVVALTLGFAALAPLIGWWLGPDAAYWSTPSRLPELLVGASLAVWLQRGPALPRWIGVLAPVSVVAIVTCSATFPSNAGPAFTGWLALFAVLSAALVLGLQVDGPVRRALSTRPLVWTGKVSYGLYLVHWPVFVVLRAHGWDTRSWGGAALAIGITAIVTAASFVMLERPVREARWSPARTARMASAATAVVLATVLAVPVGRGFLEADTEVLDKASIDTGVPSETLVRTTTSTTPATSSTLDQGASSTAATTTVQATTTTIGEVVLPLPSVPNRPVRILVVGDSTAFYVGQGLAAWAVAHPQHAQADLLWCQGCGFVLDGTVTSFDAAPFVRNSNDVVSRQVPETVARVHPDVVMLMTTIDDVADRQWSVAEGTLTPRDARFRQRMKDQYLVLTDSLVAAGVPTVVWVLPPVPVSVFDTADLGEKDRYQIQHDVIHEVVAESAATGAAVRSAELATWFEDAGHDTDETWRPDGTHLTEESAGWLAERWLGPWLVNTALGG